MGLSFKALPGSRRNCELAADGNVTVKTTRSLCAGNLTVRGAAWGVGALRSNSQL